MRDHITHPELEVENIGTRTFWNLSRPQPSAISQNRLVCCLLIMKCLSELIIHIDFFHFLLAFVNSSSLKPVLSLLPLSPDSPHAPFPSFLLCRGRISHMQLGALSPDRAAVLRQQYSEFSDATGVVPAFHYGAWRK